MRTARANIWSGRAGTRRLEVAALARTPHIQRSQEIATERHGKSRWGRGVFTPCAAPPGGHPRAIASCCGSCPAVAAGAQVPRCPAAVPSCPGGAARRTSFPSIPSIEGLLLVLPTEESAQRCPEIEAQLTSAEPLPATTSVAKPKTPRPDRQKPKTSENAINNGGLRNLTSWASQNPMLDVWGLKKRITPGCRSAVCSNCSKP